MGPPQILGPFAPVLVLGAVAGLAWGWVSGTRRGHGRAGRLVAGTLLGLIAAALLVNLWVILRRL
ncbi:MAG: hypothetical protein H6907_10370 [Hyphomicrobiales bacterium]|nr:hypothetical protein [Hyphomicrobiales bacterium]MCP5372124.1 hypothetical protein [Hyphomicrobiales bacterium]